MARLLERVTSMVLGSEDENTSGQVRILVYDKTKEGDQTTNCFHQDEKCEDVCRKLGEKFNISPAMLHCFSLAVFTKLSSDCLWLGPNDKLGDLVNGETVHFRMRFIPAKDKCKKQLRPLDEKCLCYLYFQMKWDFLHDKFEAYLKKENERLSRTMVAFCIFIAMRIETEVTKKPENVKEFLKNNNIKSFYPNSLECNIVGQSIQNSGVIERVKQCQEDHPNVRSIYLMIDCINCLLNGDQQLEKRNYYLEYYDAHKEGAQEKPSDLKVIIQMDTQASVVIRDKTTGQMLFASPIKDVDGIEMSPVGECFKVTITKSAQNVQVYFGSRLEAVSCVTCVETYYRLTCDFYTSLCPDVEPTDLKIMKRLRVHGPVTNNFVKQKLQRREKSDSGSKQNVYILRASRTKYDEYEVLYKDDRSGRLQTFSLGKVMGKWKDYRHECTTEDQTILNEVSIRKLKVLFMNAIKENATKDGLVAWLRLNPQSEGCDVLQILLEDNQVKLAEEEEEEEAQAKVYKSSSVQLHNLIGQGHFTETYEAKLCNRKDVIAKQLRYSEIPDISFKQIQESFQDSFDRLLELKNPKFFAEFIGVVMSRTPAVLMKQYKHGNLRCFLQSPEPREHQLTLRHLCDVLVQLVSALDYMDQNSMCHGNLHCDNILVDKFERNGMTVHIADPGLISLYNKLGLNSYINKRRLPWIAPELYEDLSRTTIKTDMFAFGTTLWQMFSDGKNPLDVDPALRGKSVLEIREYFSSGNTYLVCPLNLREKKHDNRDMRTVKRVMFSKLIKLCWKLDPEERITPKNFLRAYNNSVQSCSSDYHDYNVISKEMSYSGNSGVVSTIQTRKMPVSDVELLYSRGQAEQSSSSKDLTAMSTAPIQAPVSVINQHRSTVPQIPSSPMSQERNPLMHNGVQINVPAPTGPGTATTGLRAAPTGLETAPTGLKAAPTGLRAAHTGPGTAPTGLRAAPTGLGTAPTGLKVSPTGLGTAPTGLETAPTGLGTAPTGLRAAPTGLGTAPTGLKASPTGLRTAQGHPRLGSLPGLPVSDIRHLIAEDRLSINWGKQYGQGHYGAVYKGMLAPTSSLGLLEPTEVAVKVLKDDVVNEFGHEFIEEANVMERLNHKNIVKFYGVSKQAQYLIMEFVAKGCLYTFVKKTGDGCARETSLKFCVDIASGMEYLSEMKVLHRDLAARNVLITNNLDAKISDFGMSKVLEKDEEYYRRAQNVDKNMPVLWSAPEWIGTKKFTTKSDVWSFGVVLWEVYSKGATPNICEDMEEFKKTGMKNLHAGRRLAKPERCSAEVYELMKLCWDYDPEKRPTFSECHARLKVIAGIVDEESSLDGRDDYSVTNTNNMLVPNTQRHEAVVNGNTTPSLQRTAAVTRPVVTDNHVANGNSTAPPVISPRTQQGLHINGGVFSVPISTAMRQNGHGDAVPSKQSCFLDKAKLTTGSKLGEGGFGVVYKGDYSGRPVAVKKCTSEDEYRRFRREIDLLHDLNHRNVIKSIGVIYNGEADVIKLELVLEFMDRGSLSSCLKNKSCPLSVADKVDCLIQIAEGMDFLYKKKILHGDLTADNVLVSSKNDELIAKISDFGWAKQLEGDDEDLSYQRENPKFKVLWTAYEVLMTHKYTKYSDIWSYGSLAIEVFGDGKVPDMDPPLSKDKKESVSELTQRLSNGERFAKPMDCPNNVFSIIKKCWIQNPPKRIMPIQIVEALGCFRAGMNNQI